MKKRKRETEKGKENAYIPGEGNLCCRDYFPKQRERDRKIERYVYIHILAEANMKKRKSETEKGKENAYIPGEDNLYCTAYLAKQRERLRKIEKDVHLHFSRGQHEKEKE